METSDTAAKLNINFTFFVIFLAGMSAFGSFVNDMFVPSLPRMMRFFGCSVPMVQMGLTMGMIGLAAGQILLGPLSDKYGRKPVLVWSLLLFCVAAVVSIFSPTIHFFLLCRLFQGIGASGGYFLARTIPTDVYSGRQLARTMAVIGAINGFAPASAPVLGGVVADWFDWQGVFVVLTLFAVVLLCFSPRLKETLPPSRRDRGSLMKAFSDYLPLLCNRPFMVHVLLKGAALGVLFAYISSAPFIMQTDFGFSQTVFGLIIGANALSVAAGSMVALRFRKLKSAAFWGGVGLMASVSVQAVSLFLTSSFPFYEIMLVPMLFSLGMIFTAGNTLAMNEGRANAGAASAIVGVMGYVFGAIVSPLVGMGDVKHSTAVAFLVLSAITLVMAVVSRRLPADLDAGSAQAGSDSGSCTVKAQVDKN